MKFNVLQQIPSAISFSELEAEAKRRAKQNPKFNENNWEYYYGLYYKRDLELEGNLAILEQAIRKGFFPPKETLSIEWTLKEIPLGPTLRKAKERFIKRARALFGITTAK